MSLGSRSFQQNHILNDAARLGAQSTVSSGTLTTVHTLPIMAPTTLTQQFDPKIRLDALPAFPMLDYMPGTATSLNAAAITEKTFRVNTQDGHAKANADLAASMMYETSAAALYGYKLPLDTGGIPPMDMEIDTPDIYDIDKDVYYQVMSSSLYGDHAMDEDVYEKNTEPRVAFGDYTYARSSGLERETNLAIRPRLPRGLPFSTGTAVPSTGTLRINGSETQPIMTAPRG
jgi:hypothetical protein